MVETISFEPIPDPPPMEVGDTVTVLDPSGVAVFRVTAVEPSEDEDGYLGQRVTFGRATP